MGEQEILRRVAHAAVSVQGEGALGLTLLGDSTCADIGHVLGGSIQGTGVLLDTLCKHDPVALLGLGGGISLDGKDEVIGLFGAGVVRAGHDALLGLERGQGFGNSHRMVSFQSLG